MGYLKTAAVGVSWLAVLRFIIRGLTFIRLFFLARLLTPAQFGTFGVASLVLALVEVFTETGVNIVLVQEKRENVLKYLSSAWVVSIGRGILIGLLVFASSWFVAGFFNNAAALPLVWLIALVPVVRGFINPAIILYQKDLQFSKEVRFRGIVVILGTAVTLATAFIIKSPAALVIGMLVEAGIEVCLSFLFLKERPSLSFTKEQFSHIFNRGKWITIAGVFEYLFQQIDDIIVGRKMTSTDLGHYQMAYRLAMLPITEVTDIFNKVTFPVYTKLAGDAMRLRKAFFRTVGCIGLLSFGFAITLMTFPKEITQLLLGEQWFAIIPIISVLAITGAVRGVSIASYSLFLSVKKQEYVTYSTIVGLVVLATLIWPMTASDGLLGAAWATLWSAIAALPVVIFFVTKVLTTRQNGANLR